jgi:hypothetical protein
MTNYFPAQTTQNQTTTSTWAPTTGTTGTQAMWNPPGILNNGSLANNTLANSNLGTTTTIPPTTLPAPAPAQDTSWMPETLTRSIYTPAYLTQNIGSLVRVEFLIGSNMTDRVGVLSEVGASYIVLASLEGASRIMCDIYAIKFVTIISRDVTNTLINTYGRSAGVDAGVLLSAAGRV